MTRTPEAALKLRLKGVSYAGIAKELGVAVGAAYRLVKVGAKRPGIFGEPHHPSLCLDEVDDLDPGIQIPPTPKNTRTIAELFVSSIDVKR